MLWNRKHEPDSPTHAELRTGAAGWRGSAGTFWVDPRNERVLWAHNRALPAIPPKLPTVPLPTTNRRQRRDMPGLNRINRETLRQYRAAPADTGVGASGTATSASSVATSSTVTPSPGNCLAGFVVTPTGTTVSGVADGTNQYTLGPAANNASGARVTPFYANNVPTGTYTVTATLSGTAASAVIGVREYSGVGSIAGNRSLIDASAQAAGNTNAPTASATPQQAGSLYVVGVGDLTGGVTYTAGGSITRRLSVTSPVGLAIGEQVGTTVSLATASAWSASGTVQWSEAVLVLRPAGAAPIALSQFVSQIGIGPGSTAITGGQGLGLSGLNIVSIQTKTTGVTTVGVTGGTPTIPWTCVQRSVNGTTNCELSVWMAYFPNVVGNFAISAAFSAATTMTVNALWIPGAPSNINFTDIATSATGTSTAVSVTSAATVIPGEISLLFVGVGGTFTSFTNQAGTNLIQAFNSGNGSQGIESLILSTTGAQTMTATLGASSSWSAILLTIPTGGVSIVQWVSATAGSGNLTPTLPFNTAPGNLLAAKAMVNNQAGLSSVTGTNTWARAKTTPNASGGTLDTWYAKNIGGGTVQPTFAPGAVKSGVLLYELSGFDTTAPFDIAANSTGNGQSPSVTTGVPNNLFEVVFGGVGDVAAGKAITTNSPAAMPQAAITTNVDLAAGFFAYFSPGAVPSAQTFGASIPTSASQYSADVVLFKIKGSGAYTQGITTTNPGTGSDSATGLLTHKGITSTNAGTGSDAATGRLTHSGVTTTHAGAGSTSATGRLYHYAVTTTNPGTGSATVTIGVFSTRTASHAITVRATVDAAVTVSRAVTAVPTARSAVTTTIVIRSDR